MAYTYYLLLNNICFFLQRLIIQQHMLLAKQIKFDSGYTDQVFNNICYRLHRSMGYNIVYVCYI